VPIRSVLYPDIMSVIKRTSMVLRFAERPAVPGRTQAPRIIRQRLDDKYVWRSSEVSSRVTWRFT
jgi:hypothetical protein